jgi:hypothetical protein
MITRALLVSALLSLAAPAMADERLSAKDFADFVTGYTLYYETEEGERFGSETFHDKGFVTWRDPNGNCIEGGWRPYNDDICFLYDGEVQCWAFFEGEAGRYVSPVDEGEPKLRVARRDRTPLSCFGEEFDL